MLSIITGFFWLLAVLSMIYLVVLFLLTFGWIKTPHFVSQHFVKLPEISIVVAARNESANIDRLLSDIIRQDYPKDKFELLVVNDHSDDDTAELVKQFAINHPSLSIHIVDSDGIGKKAALHMGIDKAHYSLIATTDGDCTMAPNWLKHLAAYYELKKPKMVVGPVIYAEKKGFLQLFFMLDFMSLVAAGAGSLGLRLPLMVNGANLLFEKEAYKLVFSEQQGKLRASGDDVFLLYAMAKRWGARQVQFIKAPHAMVETEPPENLKQFLQQRIRWASKATSYRSWWPVVVSFTVFLFNLALFISLSAIFVKAWFMVIYLLFTLLKITIDFPLLRYFSEFANRKNSLNYLFVFGWIYPVYITVTAFYSFFMWFSWKGREKLK